MSRNWPQWLAEMDEKIKAAKGDLAKAKIQKLNLRQIPREYVLAVANLMRRLNLSVAMLRLLTPLFSKRPALSDDEKALFALALSRIGVYARSEEIFQSIERPSSQILLYRASAYVSQWEYEKAQTIYQQMLRKKDLAESEVLIAKINLASCQIHLRSFQESLDHLDAFADQKENYTLLYGNSLELKAQSYIGLGNFEKAKILARESYQILNEGDSDYSLYSRKWELIADGLLHQKLTTEWRELHRLAADSGDLETLRDLELYEALISGSETLFLKVYFGTPFKSYRKHALELCQREVPPYLGFTLNPEKLPLLDLKKGRFTMGEKKIHFTPLQIRLLRTLTKDFYRPIPLGELFVDLYPRQKFDIYTSPHRLFQSVQNLRKLLKTKEIPLQITMKNGAFLLNYSETQVVGAFRYKEIKSEPHRDLLLQWIQQQTRPFSRHDLEEQMQISRAQAVRWLLLGVKKKWIQRAGAGNHFRYRTLRIIDFEKSED